MKSMTINHTVRNGEYYSLKGVKLTASALTLNAADLVSPVASRSVATVTLEQCFIGAKSTITMVGGGPAIELLKLNGSTTNNGRIDIRAGGPGSGTRTGTTYAEIHIGTGAGGARFENRGVIGESDGNNKFSSLNIVAEAGNATFINNGKINPTTINIDADMLGHGTIVFAVPEKTIRGVSQIANTSHVEVDRKVGSGQLFDMTNDGSLTIGDLKEFRGAIKGFGGSHDTGLFPTVPAPYNPGVTQDWLYLRNTVVTDLSYNGTAYGGSLTVKGAGGALGSIHMIGDYRNAHFSFANGSGDTPTATISLAA